MAKFKIGDKVKFVACAPELSCPENAKWIQESINKEILTIAKIVHHNSGNTTYLMEELPYAYSENWIELVKPKFKIGAIDVEEYAVSDIDINDIWPEIIKYAKNNNSIKEENTMKPNYNAMTTINPNPYADPEEIEYDQKVKALQDEAEQKILDIRRELAYALEIMRVERDEKANKEREQRTAKMWKTKYDALVEAGFTAEQAWEMTMKSFEMD